jgi:GNAT superfamily N-acetyltransferase
MLRQAGRSDIDAIQRVRHAVRENRLTSLTISDEDVRRMLEERGRGWVVEDEGRVVAFAVGDATNGNVWALFVDPAFERRGHGRRLHDTMVRWLWDQGLDRLWLTTGAGTRAERLYRAAGWQCTGPAGGGELRFEMNRPPA